ncbi:E3 ubiquitin-protein ligase [Canna indica]|uniref:U-box domain-containing protein n=1 Tax=Canna indica TaxID=4628 RepID=A0AAQ3KG41_9LILI|nr:E3 ubiquitin-protein ligase [Canna indica]
MDEAPILFRCPISMELMEDPVTITTGVTYERKNIEKWLFTYKKTTCPATMQMLESFDLTPNLTLKRLISSFMEKPTPREPSTPSCSSSSTSDDAVEHGELVALLSEIQTGPFKATGLRKLKSLIEKKDRLQKDLIESGSVQVMFHVVAAAAESSDFAAFRACEEALGVLALLPLLEESTAAALLLKPECTEPTMAVLRRGSAAARVHAMEMLTKIAKIDNEWTKTMTDQDADDVLKSLLEVLSDEISISTKLSSSSLDVLLEIAASSKKNRLKAIEAGAVRVLVELLPEANRHSCEKALLLLKRLCEREEGRRALAEHGMGVAAVSKKMLRVSEAATKLSVKILWLMSSFLPAEEVLEEMMVSGSVRKLLALVQMEGEGRSSSTKEKAIRIIKLHGHFWSQYACFPAEFKHFLRLTHH